MIGAEGNHRDGRQGNAPLLGIMSQNARRVLRIADDTRRMTQDHPHTRGMPTIFPWTTELGVGEGDQVMGHHQQANPFACHPCTVAAPVQAAVPHVQYPTSHRHGAQGQPRQPGHGRPQSGMRLAISPSQEPGEKGR
jgi:hypothetical protein